MQRLGIDPMDPVYNITYARRLYDESGLVPWSVSKGCWGEVEGMREEERKARDAEEEKRTTAFGLFNHAHSYWRGAVALQSVGLKEATHPKDPVWFLYCHAVELFLKSYLRANGKGAVVLRKDFGHDVIRLANAALKDGLVIEDANFHTIGVIDAMNPMTLRYIVMGSARRIDFDRLDDLCRHLHGMGFEQLRRQGHPMRRYADIKPT